MITCASINRELDQRFGTPRGELSEEARRHLAQCERCRALHAWILESPPRADVSPELRRRISGTLTASLRRVNPRPPISVLAARFLMVFCLFAGVAAAFIGMSGLRYMSTAQLVGMSTIFMAGAALLSLSLAWQMTPGSLQRYAPKTLVPLLAGVFWLSVTLLFSSSVPEAFVTRGLFCLGTGLLMAAPASVLFWLLMRRGSALAMGPLGASLGAIAGLAGVTVLQLTCSHQDLGHLFTWHGAVLVASISLGVLIAAAGPAIFSPVKSRQ